MAKKVIDHIFKVTGLNRKELRKLLNISAFEFQILYYSDLGSWGVHTKLRELQNLVDEGEKFFPNEFKQWLNDPLATLGGRPIIDYLRKGDLEVLKSCLFTAGSGGGA